MPQDVREEAAPLFGQGDHSAHMLALLLTLPTHAECCRMQGTKLLHSLGKWTTQHRSKHCWSQSQHKLNDARCQGQSNSQHMLSVAGCQGGSSSIVWARGPLITGAGAVSEGPMRPTDARLVSGHSLPALPAAGADPAAAGFSVCPQCACTGSSCWAWCCGREPWDL